MSLLLLVLLALPASASPYADTRQTALDQGRLLPGDTGIIVGLAGDAGCPDPSVPDGCAWVRIPARQPATLELVPIMGWTIPRLGRSSPGLLVPRFPYGFDEPVLPFLEAGKPEIPPADEYSWLWLPLNDESTGLRALPVQLLVDAGPDPGVFDGPDHEILLPLQVKAASFLDPDGSPIEVAWSPMDSVAEDMLTPDQARLIRDRLSMAWRVCRQAAEYRPSRGHRRRHATAREAPPLQVRMAVDLDAEGVARAVFVNWPYVPSPDLATCLEVNGRQVRTPKAADATLGIITFEVSADLQPP